MLTDEIRKTVKNMKKLDTVESAVQNAEKKAKNDSDFSNLVSELTNSTFKLSEACKQLGFKPSQDTFERIEEGIRKIEDVISSGVVDEVELVSTRQHIAKKVDPSLSKEWKDFHKKKTTGLSAKLSSMGGLVQDPDQIVIIKQNIANGAEWSGLSVRDDGVHTRLELLTQGISQVDQLEHKLNLSDEIRDFVVRVTNGKARVTDLNQTIIDWIIKENLTEKFVISFKSNN